MKNSIISSLLLLMIVSCNSKSTEEKTEESALTTNVASLTDAQLKNATIEVGSLQKRSISSTLKVNGKIDVPPQNLVSVSMPLGGYLKSTQLLPGLHINKGEVIATMEDQQYVQLQQDYLSTKSKISICSKRIRTSERIKPESSQ
jgi:cobalt-zinc-cadmium efflux system membrane fusion protein